MRVRMPHAHPLSGDGLTRRTAYSGRMVLSIIVVLIVGACGDRTRVSAADSLAPAGAPVELQRSELDYLSDPAVLVVGPKALYVADNSQGAIVEYSRAGQLLRHIGTRGNGPGQYIGPTAMALLHDTLLYVADAAVNRASVFVTTRGTHYGAYYTPSQVFNIAERGDTVVFGMQDIERKTSVGRLLPGDSVVWQIGPIATDILRSTRLARFYPLSLVSLDSGGYRVAFTGSALTYRITTNGTVVDSAIPPTRRRRGVPRDLDALLDSTRKVTNDMAAPASLLAMMAALPDGGTVMVHLDFIMDRGAVVVRAFLSTLDRQGGAVCTDQIIPIADDARPVFAVRGDTLFVVQNRLATRSGAVGTVLSSYLVSCEER